MDSIKNNRQALLVRSAIGISLLAGVAWLIMEGIEALLPLSWILLALYIATIPFLHWRQPRPSMAAPKTVPITPKPLTPPTAKQSTEQDFWKERLEAARHRRALARSLPPPPKPVVVQPPDLLDLQIKLSERLHRQGRDLPPEQLQQLAQTVLARLQGQAAALAAMPPKAARPADTAPDTASATRRAATTPTPAATQEPTSDSNRYAPFFARCNSRLEKQLLAALIQQARLVPQGDELCGQIRVNVQVKILKYYFDFLIDNRYVLEIVEFDYKNEKFTDIHDRIRNETLALSGYRRVKVTAERLAANPQEVARRLIALVQPPAKNKQ